MKTNLTSIANVFPVIKDIDLWQPQIEAIEICYNYYSDFTASKIHGSSLVQMPTGTGKTGIIAILSRGSKEIGFTLVISPRIAIRDQLYKNINKGFFAKWAVESQCFKKVIRATKSFSFESLDKDSDDIVLISTVQLLHSLSVRNKSYFETLASKIKLVIFDEGHYEPAISWSKTIRSINCAKIIFTATPFRNDFKRFDINENYIYKYSYSEAEKYNLLRQLEIIPVQRKTRPKEFVKDLLFYYKKFFPSTNHKDKPRVIVRCKTDASIRSIVSILLQKKQKVIAIHENFKENSPNTWEFKKVPDPIETDAIFWVHQNKLLEGIDDPRFQLLATYDEPENTRSLIQQIGRILRNIERKKDQIAYFIDHSQGKQKRTWDMFRAYDDLMSVMKIQYSVGINILNEFIETLPSITYVDRKIREKFQLKNVNNVNDEIQVPLTTNFIKKEPEFNIKILLDFLNNKFNEEDRYYKLYVVEPRKYIYVSYSCRNSPYLVEKYFYEVTSEITVIYEFDDLISFFDSSGYVPINTSEVNLGKSLNPSDLKKLIRSRGDSHLTSVSLKNSNLGPKAIRAHSFSAASIDETIPFLDDYSQILSNVTGYSDEEYYIKSAIIPKQNQFLYRRYIGFTSGKVSQSNQKVGLDTYFQWVDSLVSGISSRNPASRTFNRYSTEFYKNVQKPNPRNILLDIADITEMNFIKNSDNQPMYIPDLCHEVLSEKIAESQVHYFKLQVNSNEYNVLISYDYNKKKYLLKSDDLNAEFSNIDRQHIINELNKGQLFRIIPEETNIIYAYGQFYQPAIKTGRRFKVSDFQLGNLFHTDDILDKIGDEKGKIFSKSGNGWDNDTLFDLIDNGCINTKFNTIFGSPDILICDDLGTETADFILSDKNRVVFIHVKGVGNNTSNSHKYAASPLMNVCGQATKNIQYLSMFNDLRPKNLNSWGKPWILDAKRQFIVNSRIRHGQSYGNPEEIWNIIKSRIRNHLTYKEVWLFLGKILSEKTLIQELKKTNTTHEALQTSVLLHSTMTSVGSIDAKLRIFCAP